MFPCGTGHLLTPLIPYRTKRRRVGLTKKTMRCRNWGAGGVLGLAMEIKELEWIHHEGHMKLGGLVLC